MILLVFDLIFFRFFSIKISSFYVKNINLFIILFIKSINNLKYFIEYCFLRLYKISKKMFYEDFKLRLFKLRLFKLRLFKLRLFKLRLFKLMNQIIVNFK